MTNCAAAVLTAKIVAEMIKSPGLVSQVIERIRQSARPMPNEPLYGKGLLGAGFIDVGTRKAK